MRDQVPKGLHAVRAAMTRDVIVARPDSPVRDVAELMGALRLRLVPVVDMTERVVGVVSVGDLARRGLTAGRVAWWRRKRAYGTAAELMSAPAFTVAVDAGVAAAARTMVEQGVRALPVVSRSERLQGIVTAGDLVRSLVRPDDGLADDVTDVLEHLLPSVASSVTSVVRDGVVTLTGRPSADWTARLAVHLVRNVAGVVAVDDRLERPGRGQATDEGPWSSTPEQRNVGSVDSRSC